MLKVALNDKTYLSVFNKITVINGVTLLPVKPIVTLRLGELPEIKSTAFLLLS